MGRPISQADGQITAIARFRGMAVATRNIRDFEDTGIDVIDLGGAREQLPLEHGQRHEERGSAGSRPQRCRTQLARSLAAAVGGTSV